MCGKIPKTYFQALYSAQLAKRPIWKRHGSVLARSFFQFSAAWDSFVWSTVLLGSFSTQAKSISLFMLNTMLIFLLLPLTILLKRSKEYNLPQSQEKQIKCYNSLAVLIQVIILKRFQTLFITWSDQVDRALKSPKVTIVKARACLE